MKKLFLVLAITSIAGIAAGQPSFPHILDGEDVQVSDGPFSGSGDDYDGSIYAVAVDSGEELGRTEVDDGSYEDLLVSEPEEGSEFTLGLGSQVLSPTDYDSLPVEWESGEVENISDISAEVDSLDADIDVSDTEVNPGDSVDFDASGSSGSTGVVSYEWDFDNGESGSNVEQEVEFDDTGNYEVELTVEDEVGNSDTEEVTVNVEEPPSTTSVDSDTSVDTDSDSETEIQTDNQAQESDGSSDEDQTDETEEGTTTDQEGDESTTGEETGTEADQESDQDTANQQQGITGQFTESPAPIAAVLGLLILVALAALEYKGKTNVRSYIKGLTGYLEDFLTNEESGQSNDYSFK
jgi:hypothetical protein